jgi:hypothetical protein
MLTAGRERPRGDEPRRCLSGGSRRRSRYRGAIEEWWRGRSDGSESGPRGTLLDLESHIAVVVALLLDLLLERLLAVLLVLDCLLDVGVALDGYAFRL